MSYLQFSTLRFLKYHFFPCDLIGNKQTSAIIVSSYEYTTRWSANMKSSPIFHLQYHLCLILNLEHQAKKLNQHTMSDLVAMCHKKIKQGMQLNKGTHYVSQCNVLYLTSLVKKTSPITSRKWESNSPSCFASGRVSWKMNYCKPN